MEATLDWGWVYKLGREVLLFAALVGLTLHLFRPKNRARLEEPAQRMLEEDDA